MPLFAIMLLVNLAASAIMGLVRPKQKLQAPKASTLADLTIPTATEARSVAYSAGTVKNVAANFTWWGDLEARLITKFVKTSIIGTGQRVPLGYRYNMGWQVGLTYGPQHLVKIKYDGKVVWEGIAGNTTSKTALRILQENLFGGEGEQGEGGINWILNFYRGDSEQDPDTYIESQVAHEPAHLGVSYVVSEGPSAGAIFSEGSTTIHLPAIWGPGEDIVVAGGQYLSGRGYIGKIAQMRELAFYHQYFPSFINPTKARIGDDANAVEVMAEFWGNKLFGAGRPLNRLNSESWIAASNTLFDEDFGVSCLLENAGSVDEIWDLIKETIDAVTYENFDTGLIDIKLIRKDYNVNELRDINEHHIQEWLSFETTNFDTTTNELHFTHKSRDDDYADVSDVVHDGASFEIRGLCEPAQADFPLIYRRDLAQRVALNRLRPLALPLKKGSVKLLREGSFYYPGDVIKISYPSYGLTSKPFRVMKIDYGNIKDGSVIAEVMEDKFAFSVGAYNILTGSGFINPDATPTVAEHIKVFEQPYFLTKADVNRIWSYVQQPTNLSLGYDVQASVDSGASYAGIDSDVHFTPVGTLYADLAQLTAVKYNEGIELVNVKGLDSLPSFNTTENEQGGGWLFFEDTGEIMDFQTVTNDPVTGRFSLWLVRRGILDTCPLAHAAGERVWVIGAASSKPETDYAAALTVKIKHQTKTSQGTLDILDAVAQSLLIAQRSQRPLPPNYVKLGGDYDNELQPTGDVVLTWSERNRLTQATVITQDDTTVAPEAGVTYEVDVYNTLGEFLNSYTGLTDPEFTYENDMELADTGLDEIESLLTFKIFSKRDGLRSYVPFVRNVFRVDPEVLEGYSGAYVAGGRIATRSTDDEVYIRG